jgi:outer membrane receptor protein involved in Fe transport
MKHIFPVCLLLFTLALLCPMMAWAGPGKIAGKVLDNAGEAVIGASVQILETQQGTAVGVDGHYVILGVQPGTYSVRFTCVGYAPQLFKDVSVSGDLTTTINVTMEEEALKVPERVIEYTAPPVQIDVTSKQTRWTREDIETRAVIDVKDLLRKQPGFKVDPEGALHVRGGRASELLVKVDGVDFRDPLVTNTKQIVNLSALNVEEIEVLTGGDASYGGFQSALVNVTTPEGSMTDYSGILEWRTDRLFQTTSHYQPWNKTDLAHDLQREGLNPSSPVYQSEWNAPVNNPAPLTLQMNGWNTDQYDYSLSGPVPLADHLFGRQKLSFFTSGTMRLTNTYTPYSIQRDANDYLGLGFDFPERQNNEFSTFWKLTYRMDQTKKLNLSFQRDFSQWDIYPDGEAAIDGDYGWQYKYDVANRPYARTRRQAISLSFSHNVSKRTLYEVSFGNFITATRVLPRGKSPDQFTLRDSVEDDNRALVGSVDQDKDGYLDGYVDANRNGQYDGAGEGYDDVNGNGQWDRGEDWVDLNGNGVYDAAEPWIDRANPQGINNLGVWDPWDPYTDLNGNGRWDPAEPQLPEQDWNHNGQWDGERFVDANHNGRYDGWGEGYDDKNRNGTIDKRDLFDNTRESSGEPFVDGDYWFDTGEPFQDLPDSNGNYNGVWDPGEPFWDLPSSFTGPFTPRGVPTTNGVYDGPNGYFDEYELFTYPATLEFDMDPRYPVLYTLEDVRNGIRNPNEFLSWGVDQNGVPEYLKYRPGISTWTNVTLDDQADPIFDIPDYVCEQGKEWYNDYNNNGVRDALPDYFLNPGQWDNTAFWMDRRSEEWSTKFSLTSQVNKYHEIKTGFELKYRILSMNSLEQPDQLYTNTDVPLPADAPFYGRGAIRDFYKHKPWEGSVYFQDKMEFEGMIVRAGLRSDFIIQPNALLEETQRQLDVNQPGALLAKRGKFALAPRLGISHPVSTRSKLYFNYGHYYQTPSFQYYYRSATSNLSPNTLVGNPNLEYEKTISYEVGVNTEFTEDWVVDVAGYYRDVYNQIGTVEQRIGPLTLNRYFNLGYARARGFEFSIEKKPSNMWALTINYDFSFAYGKESAAAEGLQQRSQNVPENRDEHPLTWDQTHTVSAYLTVQVSDRDHPRPFGIRIPNNWYSTLEFTYGSGYPYTPSSYTEQKLSNLILANSARFPNTVNLDMKVDKYWKLTKHLTLTTGVEIYNVLNRRNVRSLYAETGNTYDASHELDQTSRYDANMGKDYDHNPRNYGAPRQILLHFRISV